jgi:hypothetical protein
LNKNTIVYDNIKYFVLNLNNEANKSLLYKLKYRRILELIVANKAFKLKIEIFKKASGLKL